MVTLARLTYFVLLYTADDPRKEAPDRYNCVWSIILHLSNVTIVVWPRNHFIRIHDR